MLRVVATFGMVWFGQLAGGGSDALAGTTVGSDREVNLDSMDRVKGSWSTRWVPSLDAAEQTDLAGEPWLVSEYEGEEGYWIASLPTTEALREAHASYDVRVRTELGYTEYSSPEPEFSSERPSTELRSSGAVGVPGNTTWNGAGPGRFEQIFGTDDRVLVGEPVPYPQNKSVTYVIDSLTADEGAVSICSGTFVDEDHVLTAAHCVFNTTTDESKKSFAPMQPILGYVCVGNSFAPPLTETDWSFEDNCEFVDSRSWPSAYAAESSASSYGAMEYDFALLELRRDHHPQGLGYGRWMALSSADFSWQYNAMTLIQNGNPQTVWMTNGMFSREFTVRERQGTWPASSYGSPYNIVWGRKVEASGSTLASETSNYILATRVDAGVMQSGSSYYNYWNNATSYSGQSHYIVGLFSHMWNTSGTADDFNGGPSVRRFRSFVLSQL